MHILLSLIAALSFLAFFVLRARGRIDAARDVAHASEDLRDAVKRFGAKRAAGRHPADVVDDARLAAAGMMAAIARMDGAFTKVQIDALRVECRAAFRVVQKDADEIAAFGRWLAEECDDVEEALLRLGARVRELASEEAQSDLIGMLERIAAAEGGVSPEQRRAIDDVRRQLLEA